MDGGGSSTTPQHPHALNGGSASSAPPASADANSSAHLSQVLQALQAIYSPQSTNDTRRQATEYLEHAKQHPDAPAHGHALARDRAQPAQLRHYGLTMLEHTIKYDWDDFSEDQAAQLRDSLVSLAQGVAEDDPVYLRNKVAQLWTELAKRSWGAEWLNMDEQLVQLWQNSLHHQAVVLYVLETLSDDVFNREDPIAGLRGSELGRACVEIFTPARVLSEQLPTRDKGPDVRYGDEGWLQRLCDNLAWCLGQDYQGQERVKASAVKTLNALRAAMSWVMPKAVVTVGIVEHVCKALGVPVVEMQLAAVEVLQSIYTRHHLDDDHMLELATPMFRSDSVGLLREVYQWTLSDMNIHDLNDEKYTLCKKLSELAHSLGIIIERGPSHVPEGSDLQGLFELLYEIFRNPSLVVSIPVLHCWTKLLRCRLVRDSTVVTQMIGGLLETCCARLVRYEAFPEDSDDVTILFLDEDLDTIPERHAFLGNYRRYCVDVIEVLVRRTPVEALEHILGQAMNTFQNLYSGQPPFQPHSFSKNASPVLHVDAQVTIIDASLKGYLKWLSGQGSNPQEEEQMRNTMEESFEQWCRQLLQIHFEDPEIRKKVIQLLSTFSTKALPDRPAFALSFLEHMLTVKLREDSSFPLYSDAVRDLERICSLEMQKLAMKFPDDFMNVYSSLEHKIQEMNASPDTDDRQRMAFNAFLFIIIHRSTTSDRATQEARMQQLLSQVKDAWRNEEFTNAMSNFQSFCGILGMGHLPEFLSTNGFKDVQDWSVQALPRDGQTLQHEITQRSNHLPLRLTKTLLAASIEKVKDGSPTYEMAARLWAEAIPSMLPNLLQLVSHAQAFNNIESNWSHLPPELQQVVRRVMTDRFWQAGISTESRDDFFARVSSSKSTYEGFASTVRGTVRQIRENCYYILYSLTRFREYFYGIEELPAPLSQALFGNASALSAHHLSVLLSMSSHLIENCPESLRAQFLPLMIEGLFRELNQKISSEWEAVNRQVAGAEENGNLTDEMKTESILRQLTFSSVSLVAVLLDPRQDLSRQDNSQSTSTPISTFILTTPSVLEPILIFCNSAIRVRDTRSVVTTLRVLRTLLPHFKSPSPIRTFFCDTLLKSAITSLHEPYFVDCQKDLASLIAHIIHLDDSIPRAILLSLPGMADEPRLDRRLDKLRAANGKDERLQRAIVLDLLGSVRGMGIHELGRMERRGGPGAGGPPRKKAAAVGEQYMAVEQPARIERGGSPGLVGVSDMFGDGEGGM